MLIAGRWQRRQSNAASLLRCRSSRKTESFNAAVPDFYSPTDHNQGYVVSISHEGHLTQTPLATLSFDIVDNTPASAEAAVPKSKFPTDGIAGIRVNHNLHVHTSGVMVTKG